MPRDNCGMQESGMRTYILSDVHRGVASQKEGKYNYWIYKYIVDMPSLSQRYQEDAFGQGYIDVGIN